MKFLKNSWYCAGWTPDIQDKPVHRKILGEDLVLFRDTEGKLIALGDRCPHRFAPLHQGRVNGNCIECPYHGLQFDGTGACVVNPHGTGAVPAANKTSSCQVEERHGVIWIWMGEASKADPSLILDTSHIADTENYVTRTLSHPVKSNYWLVVDNLMDQTHAQFLHPETVYGKAAAERWAVHMDAKQQHDKAFSDDDENYQEVWFEENEESLITHYKMRGKPTPPLWKPIFNSELCNLYSRTIWRVPANCDLTIEFSARDEGFDQEVATMIGLHLITPIDDYNCAYHLALSWNARIDDDEATDAVMEIVRQTVIDEDGDMFEKCQAYMGDNTDLFSLRPILLETDRMAIQARRQMQKLIDAEAKAAE